MQSNTVWPWWTQKAPYIPVVSLLKKKYPESQEYPKMLYLEPRHTRLYIICIYICIIYYWHNYMYEELWRLENFVTSWCTGLLESKDLHETIIKKYKACWERNGDGTATLKPISHLLSESLLCQVGFPWILLSFQLSGHVSSRKKKKNMLLCGFPWYWYFLIKNHEDPYTG